MICNTLFSLLLYVKMAAIEKWGRKFSEKKQSQQYHSLIYPLPLFPSAQLTCWSFDPTNTHHFSHPCISGEQAEAGPGLYEAGAAVQRTGLWDPQRVSVLSSRPQTGALFPLCSGHVCSHNHLWKLSRISSSAPLRGTLTGIFDDRWFWDFIVRHYATNSPPNLIWLDNTVRIWLDLELYGLPSVFTVSLPACKNPHSW